MTGQEHEVILKATKVAIYHNALRFASVGSDEARSIYPKMSVALDELVEAVMAYEEWKKEKEIERN